LRKWSSEGIVSSAPETRQIKSQGESKQNPEERPTGERGWVPG